MAIKGWKLFFENNSASLDWLVLSLYTSCAYTHGSLSLGGSKYSFSSSFFYMLMTLLPRMMTLEIHYIFVKHHIVCKLADTKGRKKSSTKNKFAALVYASDVLSLFFFGLFWWKNMIDTRYTQQQYVCNPIELCLRLITIVNTSIWYDLLSV